MAQQGYIGRNPGDGRTIVNRQTTNVNIGIQTSFTMAVGYEIGYLDVYLNGSKQVETLDYTASDGSTIDFSISSPPVQGDVLEFVAFETLNITNIKSAKRNFNVGQDLSVDGKVTIGSSLTVASDLVVNGTFTTINTEILDVEDKTVGIASTSSPSNTTADGAGIVIYGGSDGDKSFTWNTEKSNFVLVGGGVSIGTGVTISTPAANVLAFSVNSAEKARFNNFGAFTVGYEGEAWKESTYVGVLQAGSGAWIGQTPGAGARAEWVNNAYYDSVNTRWEYIAADEANRIYLENGEIHLQSAAAGSADGAITWNEKLAMTVGGDFKIGPNAGIGITISSSGNVDAIGIVTATSFTGSGANLTSLPAAQLSGTAAAINGSNITNLNASAIASGTVPTARLGSGTASSSTFLRGDSTFAAVTSTTINNNANNRVITGSGTADTLEGEANLTYDGNTLSQTIDASNEGITITASGDNYSRILGNSNRGAANDNLMRLDAEWNGEGVARISFLAGSDTTNKDDGHIRFDTKVSGGSMAERLRITSSGNVGINQSSPDRVKLHVVGADSTTSIISKFRNPSSNASSITKLGLVTGYGDTAQDVEGHAYICAQRGSTGNTTSLYFETSTGSAVGERYRIGSTGQHTFQFAPSGDAPIAIFQNERTRGDANLYGLDFRDSSNETNANIVVRQGSSGNNAASMRFYINGGTGGNGLGNGIFCAQFSQSGHFLPGANNTNDLGSTSYRWRNIYTNDLQLSNKGSTNSVDNTWGDYTIQEGESDLFLINNRNGKKFKFNLTEVL